MFSHKGGVGHAHQSVGQRDDGQQVLRGDGSRHAVSPLPHDVRQSQLQTRRQGQLSQQGLLGNRGRQMNRGSATKGQEEWVCVAQSLSGLCLPSALISTILEEGKHFYT